MMAEDRPLNLHARQSGTHPRDGAPFPTEGFGKRIQIYG